jgi:hypothetical protein
MATTIRLDGLANLQSALNSLGPEMEAAAGRAVNVTGLQLQEDIKKRYTNTPQTGKRYKRGGKIHIASSPKNAPAVDTGRLRSSVLFRKAGKMSVVVSTRIKYGAWLEFGTLDGKIKRRPAWEPAVEAMRPRFIARITAVIAGTYK